MRFADQLTADLGLADAAEIFADIFSRNIKPPPLVDVDDWADEFRFISSKASASPGPWRTERTPYTREILKELSVSTPTERVIWKKCTQIGGTEVLLCWVGYVIDYAPAPMMIVWPTSNTAKRNSKQRLTPLIDETPVLKKKVVPQRSRDSGNTVLLKEFAGGVLSIAGANSAAELKSMPIKFLGQDEIDEFPHDLEGQGDAGKLAEKRTTNFPRRKIYKTSTPTVEGFSRIDDEYRASDQRSYHVPCPECKQLQVLVWDQMRWRLRTVLELICTHCGAISPGDDIDENEYTCPHCNEVTQVNNQTLKEKELRDIIRVWYECIHCQAEINEHNKTWMLSAEAGARWIAARPGPDRAAGFHLNALYSPLGWYSWREAVKDYLDAQGNKVLMKVFTNTVLAECYEDEDAERPDINKVRELVEPYLQGKVQEGGLVLTAAVDVQGNRLEVKLKAWGRNLESWLIEYHIIHGDPEDDYTWSQLEAYINKTFEHVRGAKLKIAAVGIDSGYKTQRVYDYVRGSKHRHVLAFKGMPNRGRAILGAPSDQDVDFRGKKIKHGVKVWPIGTWTAKSLIYGRLKPIIIEDTGEEIERLDKMHFPLGMHEDYFDQLTVEKLVTFYDKNGQARQEWMKKSSERNEALDLEVYNCALAEYLGLRRLNWEDYERKLNLNQADLFEAATAAKGQDQDKKKTGSRKKKATKKQATPAPAQQQKQQPAPVHNIPRRGLRSSGVKR